MVTVVEVSDYEVPHSLLFDAGEGEQEAQESVSLVCGDGQRVQVKSNLLKQFSHIFEEVLGVTNYQAGVPVTEESCVWKAFVELLAVHASGNYNLDTSNVVSTVVMADKYDFQGIMRICDEYLAGSPQVIFSTETDAQESVFAWLLFAQRYALARTRDRCLKFIQLNTKSIDFETEEVARYMSDLGMEITLLLLRAIVQRLNDVEADCVSIQKAVEQEGMELHYIPVLKQHVVNRPRTDA